MSNDPSVLLLPRVIAALTSAHSAETQLWTPWNFKQPDPRNSSNKKNTDTHHFPHYSFSFLQTAALKWLWSVWEFMGGNKSDLEIKWLSVQRCNLMGKKKPLSNYFLHLPADFQWFLFKFSQKLEDHLSVGNVQETFQGWLRETFSLAGWKVSFLRFDYIVRFHSFSKTFVCAVFSLLHEDCKPIVFNPHLWKEPNQSSP